jgi:hypothetical protein
MVLVVLSDFNFIRLFVKKAPALTTKQTNAEFVRFFVENASAVIRLITIQSSVQDIDGT